MLQKKLQRLEELMAELRMQVFEDRLKSLTDLGDQQDRKRLKQRAIPSSACDEVLGRQCSLLPALLAPRPPRSELAAC